KFYDFSPGSWNRLVLENFNPNLLIRLLNGGVILFSFSFLLFAISYTMSSRKLKNLIFYIPISIIMLLQFIYYDPSINLALQDHFYGISFEQGLQFNKFRDSINVVFLYMKHLAIIISFLLLS